MDFEGRDIISMNDFTREEIDVILSKVDEVQAHPDRNNLCRNKVCAMMFFEPSTRTRTSFEVAMRNLGGQSGGFYDPKITSAMKEESLWDTVKMHDGYGFDVIVIRHPLKGAARLAAEAADIPVVNAGDGPNQHPTQTLLDLYSIKKTQGRIDGITIAMVGDLANGRTVHSLTEALLNYRDCRIVFISPRDLAMPSYIIDKCRKAEAESGITVQESARIED
ncbi:MAG: aspartate carbamoyltransferase, partial [Desulfomonile sp.]|nr:aspartate carbamoyltransferase [Desulfomonile sp.]